MTSSPPITMTSLLPLTQTTSHSYTIDLSDSFCIGTVPNGGYITSAFLHAASTHMNLTHPTLHTPNPINLHLEFLRRTAAGPATFQVRDVKLGRRISNLHLTLRQHRDPADESSPWQDEVEGYITMTSLARETGISHDTAYTLLPPPMAVDLSALARNADLNYILRRPDPYGAFRRASLHCEMYLVQPGRRGEDASPAIADQWVRFRPVNIEARNGEDTTSMVAEALKRKTLRHREGRWTNDSLGYVVDIFPQLNERYLNQEIEDAVLTPEADLSDAQIHALVQGMKKNNEKDAVPARTFWYPTLLLNLDVKKLLPDEGVEWLFVRVQAKKIQKGRFDLNVEVWDTDGDLVALSTHASLIVDASRNMTRTKPGKKKDSKM